MGMVKELVRETARTNVITRAFITFMIVVFTLFEAASTKRSLVFLHRERFLLDSFITGILLLDSLD